MKILIPAYFNVGDSYWRELISAADKGVSIVAVINPDSGPGKSADQGFSDQITEMQSHGIVCLGYVRTDYLKPRYPIANVIADIDKWAQWYPMVEGIFLDEQSEHLTKLNGYVQIHDHIRKTVKNSIIVSNPGQACPVEYLKAADILCLFEDPITAASQITLPSWVDSSNCDRVSVLGHSLKNADLMEACVDQVSEIGTSKVSIEYVYFTNDIGTPDGTKDPWDTLPPFWMDMANRVKGI